MTHYDFVAHTLELPAFPGSVDEPLDDSGHIMGVTVAAWLTRFPMRRWGLRWLDEGSMTMRFRRHLHATEPISVSVDEADGGSIDLSLHGPGGALAADGRAWLREGDAVPARRAPADTPVPKVPPTAAALAGRRLGTVTLPFEAGRDLRFTRFLEPDDPWRDLPLAHPAWLAAVANRLLSESIAFAGDGRWTHAGMAVHSYRPIPSGAELVLTGEVERLFEAGRHQFAEVDVQVSADGTLAMSLGMTIIYG